VAAYRWNSRRVSEVLRKHIRLNKSDPRNVDGASNKQNLAQKIGDLAMQSIKLGQLLGHGSSTLLVLGYAIFLCVNALSVAVTILIGNQSALHEIFIDSV
jgi:hypothetical protein